VPEPCLNGAKRYSVLLPAGRTCLAKSVQVNVLADRRRMVAAIIRLCSTGNACGGSKTFDIFAASPGKQFLATESVYNVW
jgi:hypothetical protein